MRFERSRRRPVRQAHEGRLPSWASYRSTEITSMPHREELMASEARGATQRPGLPTPHSHEPRRLRSRPTSAGGPPDPRPGPCTAPPFSPGPHGPGSTRNRDSGSLGSPSRRSRSRPSRHTSIGHGVGGDEVIAVLSCFPSNDYGRPRSPLRGHGLPIASVRTAPPKSVLGLLLLSGFAAARRLPAMFIMPRGPLSDRGFRWRTTGHFSKTSRSGPRSTERSGGP